MQFLIFSFLFPSRKSPPEIGEFLTFFLYIHRKACLQIPFTTLQLSLARAIVVCAFDVQSELQLQADATTITWVEKCGKVQQQISPILIHFKIHSHSLYLPQKFSTHFCGGK